MDEKAQTNGANGTNGAPKFDLEFNLEDFTAQDLGELQTALRTSDTKTASEVYAKIITRCPAEWGAPDNWETYYHLKFFSQFRHIVRHFDEAITAESKK